MTNSINNVFYKLVVVPVKKIISCFKKAIKSQDVKNKPSKWDNEEYANYRARYG